MSVAEMFGLKKLSRDECYEKFLEVLELLKLREDVVVIEEEWNREWKSLMVRVGVFDDGLGRIDEWFRFMCNRVVIWRMVSDDEEFVEGEGLMCIDVFDCKKGSEKYREGLKLFKLIKKLYGKVCVWIECEGL